MNIVRQFKITLMNLNGLKEHIVNCANADCAKFICEGLFKDYRIIDIKEKRDEYENRRNKRT